jgi:Ca-activated chloride channel family protein
MGYVAGVGVFVGCGDVAEHPAEEVAVMQFGNPFGFWLLALVPVLALFFVWAFAARRRALERFVAQPLAQRLTASVLPVARRWKAALVVASVLFVVIALAQPRWGYEWREVKSRGVDVFVLLDVSKSMLAEDVRPNRLTQAKYAVQDLLNNLKGDRIGLVAFAGTAFVQCPLTIDYEAFRLTLKDVEPGIIPRGGTAIGTAIRTALKGFEAGEGRDRAIVLITDGEQTEGDSVAAAEEAAREGVKIYAIGVGTTEGELIPVRERDKTLTFAKDREGQVVKSRLDEETLKQIALRTGGMYVHSVPGDFGIETIYDKGIAGLQKKEYEARLQKRFFERFQWALGVAVLLLTIEMFLSDRRKL